MTKKANRPPAGPPRKPTRSRDRGRRSPRRMVNLLYLFMAAVLVVGAGVGFSEVLLGDDSTTTNAQELPKFIKAAPAATREAYLYAMARQDVLQYVPCYCGCGQHSGHQSNLDCFIKGRAANGTFVFDDHGAG